MLSDPGMLSDPVDPFRSQYLLFRHVVFRRKCDLNRRVID